MKWVTRSMPDFAKLWPADAHVIGKDILVPAHGDLLAHHAARARLHGRGDAAAARPWLVEHRRCEDEQEPRQRRGPDCAQ